MIDPSEIDSGEAGKLRAASSLRKMVHGLVLSINPEKYYDEEYRNQIDFDELESLVKPTFDNMKMKMLEIAKLYLEIKNYD